MPRFKVPFMVMALCGFAACHAQTRIWMEFGTGDDDLRDGSRVEVTVTARGQRPFTQEVAGGRRWVDRTQTQSTVTLPFTVAIENIEKIDVRFVANRRFAMEDDKWWFVSFRARLDNERGRELFTNANVAHKFERDGVWTTGTLPGYDSAGQTIIQVNDENGRPVVGARGFVGSTGLGVTDSAGQIRTTLRLNESSPLVLRARIHESSHYFSGHSADSTQNWNYRVYLTNLRTGNSGALTPVFTVSGSRVGVVVRKDQPLIGLNFVCSAEWDVARSEEPSWRGIARDLSAYLYNATDGQFFVERFHVIDQGRDWDSSDFRVLADFYYRANVPNITGGFLGWNVLGSAMNMSRGDDPTVYAHEFGHFGLDVRDEYKDFDNTIFCTGNLMMSGPFARNMPQASCMMWSQWNAGKICSNHASNMHRGDNRQGGTPCWDKLAGRWSRPGTWTLTNPSSRSSIPGAITLGGRSVSEPYMQPIVTFNNADRGNGSPLSMVTVTVGGVPADQATVTLNEAGPGGRSIYLGVINDAGVLPVAGTHRGDELMVTLADGSQTRFATVGTAASQTIALSASPEEELFAQVQGGSGGPVNVPRQGPGVPLSVVCSALNGVTVEVSGVGVESVDSVALWEVGKPRATVVRPTKQGAAWVARFSVNAGVGLVVASGKGQNGSGAGGVARFALSPPPATASDDTFGPGGLLALHGFKAKVGQVFSTTEAFVGREPGGWRVDSPMVRLTTSGGLSLSGVTMELRGLRTRPKTGSALPTMSGRMFSFDTSKSEWRQVPGQSVNGPWQMASAPCPGPGLYVLMSPGRPRNLEALFGTLMGR